MIRARFSGGGTFVGLRPSQTVSGCHFTMGPMTAAYAPLSSGSFILTGEDEMIAVKQCKLGPLLSPS